jgi:6-phosphofructokinase 1
MAKTSTRVFILEVMGRHAGWIAAAGGLAGSKAGDAPHIILFPEVPFRKAAFLKRVRDCVSRYDYCVIVVSEGARYANGDFLAEAGTRDAFGHAQLGGVAPVVANMVREGLGYKYHYAVADYLQRSARHIASAVDVDQAYAVGKAAVKMALAGKTAVMPVIKRVSDKPYRWRIEHAPLSKVANKEKMLPRRYISSDGFGITESCRKYLLPLIRGENYPPYINGLPNYVAIRGMPVAKRLKDNFVL